MMGFAALYPSYELSEPRGLVARMSRSSGLQGYILRAMSLMLRAPFRPRTAHAVQLGAIGGAGKVDQPVPMDHDFCQASEQRLHDQHGDLSMRFAEHGRERQDEDFVVEIVAGMQRPVAPVFRAVRIYQRLHGTGGVLARLGQVSDGGAALVDAHALGIGVVEIDSGHVRLPRLRFALKIAGGRPTLYSGRLRTGYYGVRPRKIICRSVRNET